MLILVTHSLSLSCRFPSSDRFFSFTSPQKLYARSQRRRPSLILIGFGWRLMTDDPMHRKCINWPHILCPMHPSLAVSDQSKLFETIRSRLQPNYICTPANVSTG